MSDAAILPNIQIDLIREGALILRPPSTICSVETTDQTLDQDIYVVFANRSTPAAAYKDFPNEQSILFGQSKV